MSARHGEGFDTWCPIAPSPSPVASTHDRRRSILAPLIHVTSQQGIHAVRASIRRLAAAMTAALLTGSVVLVPVAAEAGAIVHHPRTLAGQAINAGWASSNWSCY